MPWSERLFGGLTNPTGSTSTYQISNPQPFVETDKAARTSAIFQGIQGTITSLADAYSRVKYNPAPTNVRTPTTPTQWSLAGLFGSGTNAEPFPETSSGVKTSPILWIALIGLVVVFFVMRK